MAKSAIFAFAMYKPKKGKSRELKKLLKDHIPTLRKLEFITENPAHILESEDGTIIEVFEWMDEAAKNAAHKHPAVRKIWGPMMDMCTFPAIKDLPEAQKSFPNFKLIGNR